MENVSWNDAQDFIAALNAFEGATRYALPTEAQWEYAARAGSATAFANGPIRQTADGPDPVLDSMGWYHCNSQVDYSPNWGGRGTHPVAQKEPNAWGLYDVHGNVGEWVDDWYDSFPMTPVVDPTGPSSGTLKIMRGGAFFSYALGCRSAYRHSTKPDSRYFSYGLRLALLPGH